ncbi:hypothetical protein A4X09_0g208 [Tilletia walkeri]|uniref:Phenylalanine ammonia-lyase n=1 Tax=Tilletia walkeri TaxID=117179 RepID=A0A8X7NDS0_9BASI|nr:hypothetical protein A4X09_0g208 [Tilletia walkeri]
MPNSKNLGPNELQADHEAGQPRPSMSNSKLGQKGEGTAPRSKILGSIVRTLRGDSVGASKSKASEASGSIASSDNLSIHRTRSRTVSSTGGIDSGEHASSSDANKNRLGLALSAESSKLSLLPNTSDLTPNFEPHRASVMGLSLPRHPPPASNPALGHRAMVLDLLHVLVGSSSSFKRVQLDGATLTLADFVAISRFGAGCEPHVGRKMELARSCDILKDTVEAGHVVYGTNTMFGGNATSRTDPMKVQHALTGLLYGIIPPELTLEVTAPFTLPADSSRFDGGNTNSGHGMGGSSSRSGGSSSSAQFASKVAQSHVLPAAWVRGAMLLRLNSFMRGNSAVRWEVVETLSQMIAEEITPVVPSQGSISASGDLSPLAYIAFAMAGNPGVQVLRGRGSAVMLCSCSMALRSSSISPLTFSPKEVLAITNGTSVSCSVAAHSLADAHILMVLAQLVSAANAEAMMASSESYDAFLSDDCRPHPGQVEVAANLRSFLIGSCFTHSGKQPSSPLARCLQLALDLSDTEAGQLSMIGDGFFLQQDRYPFRTAPQWLGPPLEDLMHAHKTLTIEMNSSTDNPLVDVSSSMAPRILHGGNFQALAVTNATEKVRDVAAYVGRILFAQQEELVNPALSCGLPSNLTLGEPSTEGGFKGVSIGCAALTSELGYLASRAGHFVQSAEMHNQSLNSLALISARSTATSVETLTKLLCSAIIMACQAMDVRTCFISHLRLLASELSKWFGLSDTIKPSCSVSMRGSPSSEHAGDTRSRQRALHKLMAAIALALMRHTSLDSERRALIAAKEGTLVMLQTEMDMMEMQMSQQASKEKASGKKKRTSTHCFGTLMAGAQLYLQTNGMAQAPGYDRQSRRASADSVAPEMWKLQRTTSGETEASMYTDAATSMGNPFSIPSATSTPEQFRETTAEAPSDPTMLLFQVLEPALAHVIQKTFERSRDAYFRASRQLSADRTDPSDWDRKTGNRKRAAQSMTSSFGAVKLPTSPLPFIGKGPAALYKMVRFQFGIKMHRSVSLDQPGFANVRAPSKAPGRRNFKSEDVPTRDREDGKGNLPVANMVDSMASAFSSSTIRALQNALPGGRSSFVERRTADRSNVEDEDGCDSDEEENEGPRRTLGEKLSLLYDALRDPRKLLGGLHDVLQPDR